MVNVGKNRWSRYQRNLKCKNSINKQKWKDSITFHLCYFNTHGFMSFFFSMRYKYSSFSHTVSIDFKWNKYNVVNGFIISRKIFWDYGGFGDFSWVAVADADLQTSGGGRSSRPWDKGVGWSLEKKFVGPSGRQFGLKIRGVPGPPCPSPGSATGLSTGLRCSLKRSLSLRLVSPMY